MELAGDLDGPLAAVDDAGTIQMLHRPWRVGWAVGAADRWHVAQREPAVRARIVDGMPVVETAMKVPDGDVVQRVAAVRDAGGRGAVVEFVNESAAPVSLALAVDGRIKRIQVRGSRVIADFLVALDLGRAPGGAAAADGGDVWQALEDAPARGDRRAVSDSGRAWAVVVVPLAVRSPFRAVLPAQDDLITPRAPADAARGWLAVVARAASIAVEDDTVMSAWRRGIAASILAAGATPAPSERFAASRAVPSALRASERTPQVVDPVAGAGVASSAHQPEERPRGRDDFAGRAHRVASRTHQAEELSPHGSAARSSARAAADVESGERRSSSAVRQAKAALLLDLVGLPDEADRARTALVATLDASIVTAESAAGSLKAALLRVMSSAASSAPLGETPDLAVAALRALASRRLRAQRMSGLAESAGPLADAAGELLDSATLQQVAAALDAEAPRAARDARRLLTEMGARRHRASKPLARPDTAVPDRGATDPRSSLLEGGLSHGGPSQGGLTLVGGLSQGGLSDGGLSHAGARMVEAVGDGARFGGDGLAALEAVLACLLDEGDDYLVMFPVVRVPWIRGQADVRSLITRHGRLSFSLRWHGPRPALLWELATHAGVVGIELRCGLDLSWSTTEPFGESLLAQPPQMQEPFGSMR